MWRILIMAASATILMFGFQVFGSEAADDIQSTQFRHGDLLCDKCRPGKFMVRECTETTPTQCGVCGENEYTEHHNIVMECFRCTDCTKLHQHVVLECTPATDRQCVCDDGFFLSGEFCFTHRKCPKGYGVKRKGTPLRNSACQRCKTRTFSHIESSSAPCMNHTDCGAAGLCVTRRGNRRMDNICGNCSSIKTTVATQTITKPFESAEHMFTTLSTNDENVTGTSNMTAHIGSALTWGPGLYIMIALIVIIVIIAVGFGSAIAAKKWWWPRRQSGVPTNSGAPWRQPFTMVFTQPEDRAKRSPPANNAANDRTQDPLLSAVTSVGHGSQQLHPPRPRLRRFMSRTSETDARLNQLTPELRHRPVSLPELQGVSDHIGGAWMQLGRLLGFTDGQLDCFSHDFPLKLSECVYQMLRTWKEQSSGNATVGILVDALVAVGKPDLALTLVIEEANNEREGATE
ncbi:TNFRSF11B [Branchiostoma lanceolatum]|uniref:TNFRSF11B protein n=1 Tax=Branchiostoma lanceolatum TaxID=7740 RepID=A0A8J9VHC9_BRALA|nr:TNFRSF11B [Branchiostoma lanceolatum]